MAIIGASTRYNPISNTTNRDSIQQTKHLMKFVWFDMIVCSFPFGNMGPVALKGAKIPLSRTQFVAPL